MQGPKGNALAFLTSVHKRKCNAFAFRAEASGWTGKRERFGRRSRAARARRCDVRREKKSRAEK